MNEDRIYDLIILVISGLCSVLLGFAARYVADQIRIVNKDSEALRKDLETFRDDTRRRFDDAGSQTSKLATRMQLLMDRNGDTITRGQFDEVTERVTRLEERSKFAEAWRGRKTPGA